MEKRVTFVVSWGRGRKRGEKQVRVRGKGRGEGKVYGRRRDRLIEGREGGDEGWTRGEN